MKLIKIFVFLLLFLNFSISTLTANEYKQNLNFQLTDKNYKETNLPRKIVLNDSVKLVISEKPYEKPVIANRFEYLPYGETWITEGDGNNNPKYNSQELDKETNFYFYNARHYDPEIARFVTADTVIDGEGSVKGWKFQSQLSTLCYTRNQCNCNRYMYVGGNPISYMDPTGHETYSVTRKLNAPIPGTHSFNVVITSEDDLGDYDEDTQKEFKKLSFKNKTDRLIGYTKGEKVYAIILSGTKDSKTDKLILATDKTKDGKTCLKGDVKSLKGYIEGKKDSLQVKLGGFNYLRAAGKDGYALAPVELDKKIIEVAKKYKNNVSYFDIGEKLDIKNSSYANSNTFARVVAERAGVYNLPKDKKGKVDFPGYDFATDSKALDDSKKKKPFGDKDLKKINE